MRTLQRTPSRRAASTWKHSWTSVRTSLTAEHRQLDEHEVVAEEDVVGVRPEARVGVPDRDRGGDQRRVDEPGGRRERGAAEALPAHRRRSGGAGSSVTKSSSLQRPEELVDVDALGVVVGVPVGGLRGVRPPWSSRNSAAPSSGKTA
jgi:hypothetical protein